MDVGEQPPVVIANLPIEGEPHGPPLDEPMIRVAGPRPEALNGRFRLDGLGRIDPDVAHVLVLAIDPSDDRVAVDDADHPRPDRTAGRRSIVAAGAPIGPTA